MRGDGIGIGVGDFGDRDGSQGTWLLFQELLRAVGAGGDEGPVVDQWVQEGINKMEKGGASSIGRGGGEKKRKLMVQKRRNLERSRLPYTLKTRDLAGLRVRSAVGTTW